MYVGSPVTLLETLGRYADTHGSKAKALKHYIKDSFFAPGASPAAKALGLGIPAVLLGTSLLAEKERRPETALAGGIGLLASPVLGRLGEAGGQVQHALSSGIRDLSGRLRSKLPDQPDSDGASDLAEIA